MNSSSERKTNSVLKAAGAMGIATFISRILGLVREQVFAILFGAGNMTDAFNVAFRIPNLLRDLFAEGAMSSSLVPTFTRTRAKEGERRAWRVSGLVFRVLFAVVSLLAVLGVIFAPELVGLYASAYRLVPGKFELTVTMTRIIFPFFPLVALAAAYMGILNACGKFFMPAFAPALFNLVSITVGGGLALVLFKVGPSMGIQPIIGMAIGVVAGGVVQAFSQLPALYRVGYRWPKKETPEKVAPGKIVPEKISINPPWHKDPALREMLWLMVPGTLGLAATQINILVNTILATSQSPGSVSWLNYAFRLMQFPIGIFGVSLAAATLPRLSRQWVERDAAAVSATLSRSIRYVFAVNLPASAGLAFLGYPIIELIFQYGRFYTEDTRATAYALIMYASGLTAYSMVKVLVPACYAFGNTRIPVVSSVLSVAANIVLNVILVRPLGYAGLAIGTSVAAFVNAIFLVFAARSLIAKAGGRFELSGLLTAFAKHLAVALVMGAACYASYWFFIRQAVESMFLAVPVAHLGFSPVLANVLKRIFWVALCVFEGMVIVAVLAKVFHIRDTTDALDIFFEKLRNKLRA